jgi:hypothetical protein
MRTSQLPVIVILASFALACSHAEPDVAAAPPPLPNCATSASAEEAATRASPLDSVFMDLAGFPAKLCYSRPSAKGRVMVGDLDPFEVPWRMGANEPTALHLTSAATVGSVELDAGSFGLYAVPTQDSWTIVINGSLDRWGIPLTPEVRAADIGSFVVTPTILESHVETLTFSFVPSGDGGDLVFSFENRTFPIPVRTR